MKRISQRDTERVRQLQERIGSLTLRTILTGEDRRLMRPDRLENLQRGSGKLTREEVETLQTAFTNQNAIWGLQRRKTYPESKGQRKKVFRVNRSIRDWVRYGKSKGAPRPTDKEGREKELRAIRGLRYLGVDPSERHYYLRKVKVA